MNRKVNLRLANRIIRNFFEMVVVCVASRVCDMFEMYKTLKDFLSNHHLMTNKIVIQHNLFFLQNISKSDNVFLLPNLSANKPPSIAPINSRIVPGRPTT